VNVNPALAVVNEFVDELVLAGIRDVVISPGSRSAPLAMAATRHPAIRTWLVRDERSAGFFALGLTKAGQSPAALICTSGTAAANYLPAVMEAKYARIPLLVITADRPHELRGVGSNQTVDQVKLYGSHVQLSLEMPVPEDTVLLRTHARQIARRLVAAATATSKGAVHLNWPFRDPLIPPVAPMYSVQPSALADWATTTSNLTLSAEMTSLLASRFRTATRGLIICGPMVAQTSFAEALIEFAKVLNFPVLADPLSGLRISTEDVALVVDAYDDILQFKSEWEGLHPDVVIRFGQTPTSKWLLAFLSQLNETSQFVVDDDVQWADATLQPSQFVWVNPTQFCDTVAAQVCSRIPDENRTIATTSYVLQWQLRNQLVSDVQEMLMNQAEELIEPRIFHKLQNYTSERIALFIGNSMPIRDADAFLRKRQGQMQVWGNRGTSGIDGVVSTSLGVGVSSERPLILIIGDVSFLHDLTGLQIANDYGLHAIIIVMNNAGGGIFAQLPQAEQKDTFSAFSTPHNYTFEHAAAMFGANYRQVDSWSCFDDTLQSAIQVRGLYIVEIPTSVEQNIALKTDIHEVIEKAFEALS